MVMSTAVAVVEGSLMMLEKNQHAPAAPHWLIMVGNTHGGSGPHVSSLQNTQTMNV